MKKAMEMLRLRCAGLWRKNLPGGGGFREKARGWASGEVLRMGGGVCSLVARTRPSAGPGPAPAPHHSRPCKAVCCGHVVEGLGTALPLWEVVRANGCVSVKCSEGLLALGVAGITLTLVKFGL